MWIDDLSPHSTMALPAAAAPSRITQPVRNAPPNDPQSSGEFFLVTWELDLTLRAYFPTPTAPTKFNPINAMGSLLRMMIKDEPSLVLRTPSNDKQLILASASILTGESKFKKYFKVLTAHSEKQNLSHVCIGCHVLSNQSLGNIKFQSTDGNLLAWLKKECIFIESDWLGTDCLVTIGYFTKIEPTLTHLINFCDHLVNQLMLVDIDTDTAVKLTPHLKQAQLNAMTNGDDYVLILPDFEIYQMRLSHGWALLQVTTDVLGVKCVPKGAKLLGEFFMHMASDTSHE